MKKNFEPEVIVIDVESTCWEPASSKPKDEMSEIIEIGVTVVDISKLEIKTNVSILIKPCRSTITAFCTKLTTLTPEIVNQGISYREACDKLCNDFASQNKTMISWGDYDRKMFEKNGTYHNCKYPFGPRHLNLKNCFTILHGLSREPGMEEVLDMLKIPLEGTHHRGCDDSKNIAKILIHCLEKFRK